MRLSSILLFLLYSVASLATTPQHAYVITQYSQNERYYFQSIPFSMYPSKYGKTLIYDSQSRLAVDSFGSYLHGEAYLSNSGLFVAHLSKYVHVKEGFNKYPALEFVWGRERKQLFIKDLVADSLLVVNEISHIVRWYRRAFMHNDSLFILTHRGPSLVVAGTVEPVVHHVSTEVLLNRFKTSAPNVKLKYEYLHKPYLEKQAGGWIYWYLPSTVNGKQPHDELVKMLKKMRSVLMTGQHAAWSCTY